MDQGLLPQFVCMTSYPSRFGHKDHLLVTYFASSDILRHGSRVYIWTWVLPQFFIFFLFRLFLIRRASTPLASIFFLDSALEFSVAKAQVARLHLPPIARRFEDSQLCRCSKGYFVFFDNLTHANSRVILLPLFDRSLSRRCTPLCAPLRE